MSKYTAEKLINFAQSVFEKMGCSKEDAQLASNVLISADLRGVDSHGVARLSGYVRLWEVGRINTKPNIRIIHETPSTATVDGDEGLGLVIAPKAMEIAMKKAEQVGTGWVVVQNSNHFGIAGYHSMMALEKNMIGYSMTNASPLVAPTHSKEKMLGTNPISVAFPTKNEPPMVIDMATTTTANGKLEIAQRAGKDIPKGWAQDKNGHVSTDAFAVKNGGSLLPLGGERITGGHKGYCLGGMVDILTSVLSGANYGPWAPPFVSFLEPKENPVGKGLGHFFGAMRVDAFRPADEFQNHMDNWIRTFRNAESINGEKVLIPGDPERESEIERSKNGIELNVKVVEDLEDLATKFGLTF